MAAPTIHRRLERVSRFAAILGGFGILFISFMVTIDVFLRKFFGTTLGGASEIAGMVFAVATAIAYPYVLLDRAHIRIDVVYSRVGRVARAVLDLVAMLVVLYFAARLSSSAFALLQKTWGAGTKSVGVINIPLWIPQSVWVLGFAVFALTALYLSLHAAIGIYRRDWRGVIRVAGVPSIEETIEEETHIDEEDASVPSDERKN